jgi:hypothetical protein
LLDWWWSGHYTYTHKVHPCDIEAFRNMRSAGQEMLSITSVRQ